jgi:hypothetical protein
LFLVPQALDLEELLPEVERFTIEELLPTMARGGFVDAARRAAATSTMARYSGMSKEVILQHNLAVPTGALRAGGGGAGSRVFVWPPWRPCPTENRYANFS